MKKKLVLILSSLLMGNHAAFAATSSTNTQQMEQINKLEQQLSALQTEVAALKKQTRTHSTPRVSATKKPVHITKIQQDVPSPLYPPADQIEGPTDLPKSGAMYLPVDFDVPGQSFVSSGPYIGIPLEYSGSNLIVNSPSVNEDVILLKLRKNITQRLESYGRPEDASGSHILLSGTVQGQGVFTNHSDINVSNVALDAYALGPSRWTSGLVELSYDNNLGTQSGSFSSNNRTQNSRVYVNKAFVVIGDFLESPFYASFGQMFVPFGVYSNTLVSSPLTEGLGRVQTRALVLGYKQQATNNFYASTYIFKGPSYVGSTKRVNNGGINLGYGFRMNRVNADVGGGVVANIADSQGMQYTGNQPLFAGFGGPTVSTVTTTSGGTASAVTVNTGNESLVHRVPAYDIHTLLGFGDNIQFIGEYIAASTNFNPNDMTFNSHGARPQALHLEGVYNLPWFKTPTSTALAYDRTRNALAIGLPAQRYSFVINQSWWKDTLQSLEFRHDINYSASSTSSGSNVTGPSGTGKAVNMVTFQFSYYF
jgi:hypothetical protein